MAIESWPLFPLPPVGKRKVFVKDYLDWVLEGEEDYDRKSYGKRAYKWMGKA